MSAHAHQSPNPLKLVLAARKLPKHDRAQRQALFVEACRLSRDTNAEINGVVHTIYACELLEERPLDALVTAATASRSFTEMRGPAAGDATYFAHLALHIAIDVTTYHPDLPLSDAETLIDAQDALLSRAGRSRRSALAARVRVALECGDNDRANTLARDWRRASHVPDVTCRDHDRALAAKLHLRNRAAERYEQAMTRLARSCDLCGELEVWAAWRLAVRHTLAGDLERASAWRGRTADDRDVRASRLLCSAALGRVDQAVGDLPAVLDDLDSTWRGSSKLWRLQVVVRALEQLDDDGAQRLELQALTDLRLGSSRFQDIASLVEHLSRQRDVLAATLDRRGGGRWWRAQLGDPTRWT